jgi:hypothetical protein
MAIQEGMLSAQADWEFTHIFHPSAKSFGTAGNIAGCPPLSFPEGDQGGVHWQKSTKT